MSKANGNPKRRTTGVYPRHQRGCAQAGDPAARCDCRPSWRAYVPPPRPGERPLKRTFSTHAEAKAWRAEQLSHRAHGRLVVPTSMTVADAAGELLAGMADGTVRGRGGHEYKPSAIRTYERGLRLRIIPALGRCKLSDVHRRDVQALVDRLLAEGRSASSVRNTLDPLRVIYRRAMRRDLVAVNPMDALDVPASNGRRERIAPAEEAAALIDALPDGERALWAAAFYAGLRRGELRAITWAHIDLDAGTIRVEDGWDDDEGRIGVKTKAGDRMVPILDPLRPLLVAHRLATGRRDEQLVFGRTGTDPFVPTTARARALKAWGAAGLEPITLHEARHTCASTFIASGANPKTVQAVTGHATITMTFDTYGHLFPGGLDEAAAKANEYLSRVG